MKVLKFLFKFILWTLGIIVALVLTLPLWIGPVVKPLANRLVPEQTGTAFNLGVFKLNPYVGVLSVGDMQLRNPDGFEQKMAVTLGTLHVDVDTGSLAGDIVVVEDIVLKDVFVSYVKNAKGENNFDLIAKNAVGEKKAEAPKKAAVEEKPTKPEKKAEAPKKGTEEKKPAKKVIIDHLLIENIVVQLGPVSIPMPKIELSGIGRKSNGVTMEEAWEQISVQVMSSLNAVGEFANQLGKMGVDMGDLGLEQAGKAVDAVRSVDVKNMKNKAMDAIRGVDVKGMGDAFKGGTKAAGEGAGKAVDAVGESADKAVNAIKGLFN